MTSTHRITAHYIWNIDNVRQGFETHRKLLPLTRVGTFLGISLLAWGAYESITSEYWFQGLPLILFGGFLLFGAGPLALWQFQRTARQVPGYDRQITYTFDPAKVVVSGEDYHSTFTWQNLFSATTSDEGILLYPQKGVFHWIPSSAFDSPTDMATVRSYLEQSGIRKRNG